MNDNSICSCVVNFGEKFHCSFSISIYGYECALENAKIWRINKLQELNLLQLYSERHIGFDFKSYIGKQIEYKSVSSSGSDYIWTKFNKDSTLYSVSVGIPGGPRKYFKVNSVRDYSVCIELAKEHLKILNESN